MSTTQAYRNLWDAIQDIDTPKEEHLTIKTKMMELHAIIPSEEFNVLADELPGYRAFQVRLQDLRASKFPSVFYETKGKSPFRSAWENSRAPYGESTSDSEFLAWKRSHFKHLDDEGSNE